MKKSIIILSSLLLLAFQSCIPRYSFTGSEINAKTISIDYFPNKASIIQPSLSQTLTESFRDKFANQTKLDLIKKDGELQLEGEIIGYKTSPVAISGDETASMNRLTISVKVKYTNTLDDTKSFESTFSQYEDYDATVSLTSVEDELIATIVERIVEDVFNKALVNW